MAKQEKIETISINGVDYVEASKVKEKTPRTVIVQGDVTIANALVGSFVIVRSRNEGINAGTLEAADETGCIIADCRRIYYHRPKDRSLSWYEGVAETGLSIDSKVSGTVARKVIVEDYSLTACTDEAKESIMEHKPNAQN